MLIAQKVAPPRNERQALVVTAGVWLIVSMLSLVTMHSHPQIPQGTAFRTYLEMFAEAVGIAVAFGYRTHSGAAQR